MVVINISKEGWLWRKCPSKQWLGHPLWLMSRLNHNYRSNGYCSNCDRIASATIHLYVDGPHRICNWTHLSTCISTCVMYSPDIRCLEKACSLSSVSFWLLCHVKYCSTDKVLDLSRNLCKFTFPRTLLRMQ